MRPPIVLILALALGFLPACGRQKEKAASPASPVRTEELASGRIAVTLTAEPATVRLDRPLFLTLAVTAPETLAVEWPALEDRFEGFEVAGSYDAGSKTDKGRISRALRIRLTPKPSDRYRLKAMALSFKETPNASASQWIKTKPVVFGTDPLPAASGIAPPADARTVRLTPRELALLALLALIAAGLVAGLVWLVRRLLRARRLRKMSARQRALLELAELESKHLVEVGQIKEFYFELTLVVRRYIERRHGIRAPEQTTEEFLASAGADPRFPRESLDRLQAFLTAADYVKFADYRPGPEAGPVALNTARDYVTTDPVPPEEGKG